MGEPCSPAVESLRMAAASNEDFGGLEVLDDLVAQLLILAIPNRPMVKELVHRAKVAFEQRCQILRVNRSRPADERS